MTTRPLAFGKNKVSRIIHDERGLISNILEPKRFISVLKENVFGRLERELSDCKNCPYSKIEIKEEHECSTEKVVIWGKAFCQSTIITQKSAL